MNENLREIDARRIRPDGTRGAGCWNREPHKDETTVYGIDPVTGERYSVSWPNRFTTDCQQDQKPPLDECRGCKWIKGDK